MREKALPEKRTGRVRLRKYARAAQSGWNALSSPSTMTAPESGAEWTPGRGLAMHESTIDFPVLFPLCEAMTVNGIWVSFCCNERHPRSNLCRYHMLMRRQRNGRWRGREVVVS